MPSRRVCLFLIAAVFAISRLLYFLWGVRFDTETLSFYFQVIDPLLLKVDFWRSILYLEWQVPVFNIFLGTVLKLFPSHTAEAFQAVYLGLGLVLSFSLFELMRVFRVDLRIATVLILFFILSPSAILYENILFYEYPLTVLFCVAALFLHRFASQGKTRDALVFFCSLGLISGLRGAYHLLWYVAIVSAVAWTLGKWRTRIIWAAAIPSLLLTALYAKNLVAFGSLAPGARTLAGQNFVRMATDLVPVDEINRMIAAGEISPLLHYDLFAMGKDFDSDPGQSPVARIVPVPPETGIPILDDCRKSTGSFNWNCTWAGDVVSAYRRDAMVVFRAHPEAWVGAVRANLARYFHPDTDGWPFDGRQDLRNPKVLARLLTLYRLITAGEGLTASGRPWLAYIWVTALIVFGVWRVRDWITGIVSKTALRDDADGSVLTFMLANILFLSPVVILLSCGDQNRYRSEISAFFPVLLGLALERFRRFKAEASGV